MMLIQMVQSTWKSELLKIMNKTNVLLISKLDHPQTFNHFHPISLSNDNDSNYGKKKDNDSNLPSSNHRGPLSSLN